MNELKRVRKQTMTRPIRWPPASAPWWAAPRAGLQAVPPPARLSAA